LQVLTQLNLQHRAGVNDISPPSPSSMLSILQSLSLLTFEIFGNPVVLERGNTEVFPGSSHFSVCQSHAGLVREAPSASWDPVLLVSYASQHGRDVVRSGQYCDTA
jgi:hypothetical protein